LTVAWWGLRRAECSGADLAVRKVACLADHWGCLMVASTAGHLAGSWVAKKANLLVGRSAAWMADSWATS
jgi:hypothetical protein